MRALTIHQPFASLIIAGHKRIENRTWKTAHRGDLLIHAGARVDRGSDHRSLLERNPRWRSLAAKFDLDTLPRRAILGRVSLIDCVRLADLGDDYPKLGCHSFASGPWCWVLRDPIVFAEPVPCSGRQLLWHVPPAIEALLP